MKSLLPPTIGAIAVRDGHPRPQGTEKPDSETAAFFSHQRQRAPWNSSYVAPAQATYEDLDLHAICVRRRVAEEALSVRNRGGGGPSSSSRGHPNDFFRGIYDVELDEWAEKPSARNRRLEVQACFVPKVMKKSWK